MKGHGRCQESGWHRQSKVIHDQANYQLKMKDRDHRKHNTIWYAGMAIRVQADAVNWNLFRSLKGELTKGPDVDGSEFYAVSWFLEDGSKHSTFHEHEIKFEDLILNEKAVN